jgi:hypothetical protein
MTLPVAAERRRARQIGGFALLAVGLLLAGHWLKERVPEDQSISVRLPADLAARAQRLEINFTPVGDIEPARGVIRSLTPPAPTTIHEHVRLPNGDYIVALELTCGDESGPLAPKKSETSRARRVSLSGEETLVIFDAETPQ